MLGAAGGMWIMAATVAGLVLALGGLALAVWQLALAHRAQLDALATLSHLNQISAGLTSSFNHLRTIETNLSTRPIGEFPKFIPRITAMLCDAGASIRVLCDFPGYGAVSAPSAAEEYLRQLERQTKSQDGLAFEFICMRAGAIQRAKSLQIAVDAGANSAGSLTDEMLRTWLQKRADRFARTQALFLQDRPPKPAAEMDRQVFFQMMADIDTRELARVRGDSSNKFELPFSPTLHMWLVDDEVEGKQQAILAIPSLHQGGHEFAFHTRDRELIRALRIVFNRYRQLAISLRERPDWDDLLGDLFNLL